MMDHTQIIEDTLRQLGVGGNYIAQQRAVTAIQLAIEDGRPFALCNKKHLPAGRSDFADANGPPWSAISAPWSSGSGASTQKGLAQMAGYPLSEPPTASDFIEILAHYIRRSLPTPTASLDQPGA